MTTQTVMNTVVSASGLKKSYGSLEVVCGIDFTVRRGECFGVLGPNGAGKTTTIGMVICFLPWAGARSKSSAWTWAPTPGRSRRASASFRRATTSIPI